MNMFKYINYNKVQYAFNRHIENKNIVIKSTM